MDFKPYKSIHDLFEMEYLARLEREGRLNGDFVVEEKIHGANLSLWFQGNEIRTARRGDWIDDPSQFYGADLALGPIIGPAKALYQQLRLSHGIETMVLFGELFGGTYPHADVPETTTPVVQHGIYYSPGLHYWIYDILADGRFLSYDTCRKLLREYGLAYPADLFRGEWEACIKFEPTFQSCIPTSLRLPLIPDNLAEGVIIRTASAEEWDSPKRVLIKHKHAHWNEKRAIPKASLTPSLSQEAAALEAELLAYVAPARLDNLASRLGPLSRMAFAEILDALSGDAWQDFERHFVSAWSSLSIAEQKRLLKSLRREAASLIKTTQRQGGLSV